MKVISITAQGKRDKLSFDRGFTDVVKFICCLLVASSHYAQDYIHRMGESNVILDVLSTQGGYLGVSIFFFLSGYGLMSSLLQKTISFKDFVKKRLIRVFFPAVFVSVLWITILCVFPQIPQGDLGLLYTINWSSFPESLIRILLFQFADSVLWFVEIIILLYLVIYIYNDIRISKARFFKIPMLFLMTITSTIITYYWVAPFACVSVLAFAIGVLVSEYNSLISRNVNLICSSLIFLIILLSLGLRGYSILQHGLINYVIIVLWVWMSAYLNVSISNLNRLVSDISFDIYITHKKTLVITTAFFPSISLPIFILVSLIVAIVEYYIRNVITK